MHPMLNVATKAIRKAGKKIIKYYEIFNNTGYYYKNNYNIIKRIRFEIKQIIVETIHKFYPKHIIINNNNASEILEKNNKIKWIINPLDGTENFIRKLPHFSVSIATIIRGCIEISIIYDPIRNELFSAVRGKGAKLNDYRIRTGIIGNINGAILSIDFLFNKKNNIDEYFLLIKKLFSEYSIFCCMNTNSLDLAYLASGRIDGLIKIGIPYSKFVSGELLVIESGGFITDFIGNNDYLKSGNIIAGNSNIIKKILSIIKNNKIKFNFFSNVS